MDYHIALSPELDLSPEKFAAAWNETPECRDLAQARLSQTQGAQFYGTLLTVTLTVLGSLALGAAGNALYDLIKETLMRQGVRKRTEIVHLEQPDGSRLLVVTVVEE